ncbi:MAG: ATP-binding cassette domain-containing protein [Calditrichaeota bacterium]|nr:ATP-binding cassette domain-containing protein [Calditrichota bacterium]
MTVKTNSRSGNGLFTFRDVFLEKQRVPILRNISLSIQAGDFAVLLGPSGAGKTSFLRLFNLLELPTRGEIFFKGENLLRFYPPELRQRVVMVMQKPMVFEGSVRDNLTIGLTIRKRPVPDQPVLEAVLRKCNLSPDILPTKAKTLSGGEQQRLSLARALLLEPEVLLLDEPTASLDVESEKRLIDIIVEENQSAGRTVVCVTHSLPLIQAASKLIFLDQGQIAAVRQSASNEEIRSFMKEALDGKENN